jgi:lysine 2,3-aminomutase
VKNTYTLGLEQPMSRWAGFRFPTVALCRRNPLPNKVSAMLTTVPQAEQMDIPAAAMLDEGDDEPPDPLGACPLPRWSPPAPAGRLVRFPSVPTHDRAQAVKSFRKTFYANVPAKLWNDWHWQVANRVRTAAQLSAILELSAEERAAVADPASGLPLAITPYYLSLLDRDDASQPLRRTVVPTIHERLRSPGEADDPLGEARQSPVTGLVHRYPDRVLLLLSDFCSTYCRYCTRSRVVGHNAIQSGRRRLEQALDYIAAHPAIRDVLLSGGDPLLLADATLDWVLGRLRRIPHVEIIRIGTKVPAVLPQRVTPQLARMLRRHHPLMMSLHFTHPDECTPETHKACARLADAGIPLGSQTVLLKGINDDIDSMRRLMHGLLKMRVRPYYLYQCDPITGSAHFRTPVAKGLEIIRGLRGHTSGYAVPTFVIDAPEGGGKIPLMPDAVLTKDTDGYLLRNHEGWLFRYPEACGNEEASPPTIKPHRPEICLNSTKSPCI